MVILMSKSKNLFLQIKEKSEQVKNKIIESSESLKSIIAENKDGWVKSASESVRHTSEITKDYVIAGAKSTYNTAKGIYSNIRYSPKKLKELQDNVENQGGFYRELTRNKRTLDTIFVGGESLATLLAAGTIPAEIEEAYRAAYPNLSAEISFADRVRELDENQLLGLISGVKGKLFEQKYVEYLNDGNLPEGYIAFIAESTTQPGWDIGIRGPNDYLESVLQAKATDSVSYVKSALDRYPHIDVVTTDEVYSQLVLSGVSENIANSSISNVDLVDQVEGAIDASDISMDFSPPLFALAFIAFTSYKDESLTLYEKAKSSGARSGKTYLSYLIGGGIVVITNTWWLGVLGSVSSRYLSDEGLKKEKLVQKLEQVYQINQKIINRIKNSYREA